MPIRAGRLVADRSPRGQRRLRPPGPADRAGRSGRAARSNCPRPSSSASPRARSRSRPPASRPSSSIGPDGKKVAVEGTQLYRADGQKLVTLGQGAALAPRLRRQDGQRLDRLAGGQDRRPQRAADRRLSQGDGRYPRPDRADDHRGIVRQPHRTASWKARSSSRCRRTPRSPASACGSATSWSRPTWSRSSGPGRSTRQSSARSAIRACWNGRAATSSRPACSPSSPKAEKRITITYTQVLPLRGNSYRYQYALQSELLKQHPLRQLEIDVKINSALPLQGRSARRRT